MRSARLQNTDYDIQKSVVFLYISKEQPDYEIKATIYNNTKNNVILRNISKEMQDTYIENYNTLLKEIKDDLNKWEEIPCSWIGNIDQWSIGSPEINSYMYGQVIFDKGVKTI